VGGPKKNHCGLLMQDFYKSNAHPVTQPTASKALNEMINGLDLAD